MISQLLKYHQITSCPLLVFHRKDLSDARPKMQSVFKFSDVIFALKSDGPPIGETLGQVDIFCQIFGSDWPLVRHTKPPVEASSNQEWYCIGSGWLLVRYTPLLEASSCQKWYYVRSGWHLLHLWIRLTLGQMYPLVEASSGQEWYFIRSTWNLVSPWVMLTCGQMYPW